MGPVVGPAMGLIERLTADATCLKGALRTLKMTTPIAKHPTRVFPQVISELADRFGDAPALLSDRERFSYRELAARSNRYARWALAAGLAEGRYGLPDDAEPAGISGAVARHHARRWRGGAAQHQPDRARRSHIASTSSRPSTSSSPRSSSTALESARPHHHRRREDLAARRRPTANFAAHRPRGRRPSRRRARGRASAARSPSRIARSTSTRRAPPACRRRPTSTTIA